MRLAPLPEQAIRLLEAAGASEQLKRHAILVHDCALSLEAGLGSNWPHLKYQKDVVLLGAALHDIGKCPFPNELVAPGHKHESGGEKLLLALGVPGSIASFAKNHRTLLSGLSVGLEDLLVALADKIWKGKRDDALEQRICDLIANQTREANWRVCMQFDDLMTQLSSDAHERIVWQGQRKSE